MWLWNCKSPIEDKCNYIEKTVSSICAENNIEFVHGAVLGSISRNLNNLFGSDTDFYFLYRGNDCGLIYQDEDGIEIVGYSIDFAIERNRNYLSEFSGLPTCYNRTDEQIAKLSVAYRHQPDAIIGIMFEMLFSAYRTTAIADDNILHEDWNPIAVVDYYFSRIRGNYIKLEKNKSLESRKLLYMILNIWIVEDIINKGSICLDFHLNNMKRQNLEIHDELEILYQHEKNIDKVAFEEKYHLGHVSDKEFHEIYKDVNKIQVSKKIHLYVKRRLQDIETYLCNANLKKREEFFNE